jgi:hypothetical protein
MQECRGKRPEEAEEDNSPWSPFEKKRGEKQNLTPFNKGGGEHSEPGDSKRAAAQ